MTRKEGYGHGVMGLECAFEETHHWTTGEILEGEVILMELLLRTLFRYLWDGFRCGESRGSVWKLFQDVM